MIPFVQQPSVQVGPVTIHAFGVIVATAVMVGLEAGRRRFRRVGLDVAMGERLAWYTIVGGFLGAHLFSVVLYFPDKVARDPLILLRVWEDISSFGGMIGGLAGFALFVRWRAPQLSTRERWAYLDVAAFVFAISLMIGRIACALAHDHPGEVTTFPLAISLASGDAQTFITNVYRDAGRLHELPAGPALGAYGFHDLGWYEFLYLAAIVVPVMLWLDRRSRAPGFFLGTFLGLYLPVRFTLDFLRVHDARYAGLTPAQWAALVGCLALPVLWIRVRRRSAGAGPEAQPAR